ncbi:MAG: hypothetical protein U0572_07990 [Phycisphaerales bacterium]
MSAVIQRYWGPIFAFVRATGQSPQEAVDLTQGFVADVLLGRSLLASADRKRGRFRSLLRQSVVNYVRDHVRREKSQKRQPSDGPPRSRDSATLDHIAPGDFRTAERAFDAHWAAQLIRAAAERAARRARAEGQELAWTIFERRTLRPQLVGEQPAEYAALVAEYELASVGLAAHLAIVGRRMFAEEMIAELRASLGDDEPVADEIRVLMAAVEGTP